MICAVGFIIRSESALQSYYLKHIVWRLQIIITWSIAYFKNTDSAAKSSHTHTDSPCKYLNHIELFVLSPQKNYEKLTYKDCTIIPVLLCYCLLLLWYSILTLRRGFSRFTVWRVGYHHVLDASDPFSTSKCEDPGDMHRRWPWALMFPLQRQHFP